MVYEIAVGTVPPYCSPLHTHWSMPFPSMGPSLHTPRATIALYPCPYAQMPTPPQTRTPPSNPEPPPSLPPPPCQVSTEFSRAA